MITQHDTKALLDLVAAEIADMEKERDAGRFARGEIIAENHTLRDRLAKTDATLMALCQALNLDPTGDPVAELRARQAPVVEPVPPLQVRIAMATWPGPWKVDPENGYAPTLVLANDLIPAQIEATFRAPYWCVRLNNRAVWSLLAKGPDLAEALRLARDKMRDVVADLAKGVG